MKATFIATLLLMTVGVVPLLAGDPTRRINSREVAVLPFTNLSISAKVTVILYESPVISTVYIMGKENLARKIAVLQKDSKLLITSSSNSNMKEKITVFIPVNKLRSLVVSAEAFIKSQTVLNSPHLEVDSEDGGEVHIIVNGIVKVNNGMHHARIRSISPEYAVVRMSLPIY